MNNLLKGMVGVTLWATSLCAGKPALQADGLLEEFSPAFGQLLSEMGQRHLSTHLMMRRPRAHSPQALLGFLITICARVKRGSLSSKALIYLVEELDTPALTPDIVHTIAAWCWPHDRASLGYITSYVLPLCRFFSLAPGRKPEWIPQRLAQGLAGEAAAHLLTPAQRLPLIWSLYVVAGGQEGAFLERVISFQQHGYANGLEEARIPESAWPPRDGPSLSLQALLRPDVWDLPFVRFLSNNCTKP